MDVNLAGHLLHMNSKDFFTRFGEELFGQTWMWPQGLRPTQSQSCAQDHRVMNTGILSNIVACLLLARDCEGGLHNGWPKRLMDRQALLYTAEATDLKIKMTTAPTHTYLNTIRKLHALCYD